MNTTFDEALNYALKLREDLIIFEFDSQYHGLFHAIRPFAAEHYRKQGYIERAQVKWRPEIIYTGQ